MPVFKFDTCPCSFEIDREFNFVRAVHICPEHKLATDEESFKAAHSYNQAINIAKAAQEESEAKDG